MVIRGVGLIRSADDIGNIVLTEAKGVPVFIRDVAEVNDGGAEPSEYVRMADASSRQFVPAVTLAISKRKGTNAVVVALSFAYLAYYVGLSIYLSWVLPRLPAKRLSKDAIAADLDD